MPQRSSRAGRGLGFVVIVVLIVYVLMSAALAVSTANDCKKKGLERHWVFLPPKWECRNGTYVPVN